MAVSGRRLACGTGWVGTGADQVYEVRVWDLDSESPDGDADIAEGMLRLRDRAWSLAAVGGEVWETVGRGGGRARGVGAGLSRRPAAAGPGEPAVAAAATPSESPESDSPPGAAAQVSRRVPVLCRAYSYSWTDQPVRLPHS